MTPMIFQAICSNHWTTWHIIKYTEPWGFRPCLSNIQEFTEQLWILKSLFKKKHSITPTQTTSKILKYAEDTSLINSLVMKSFVVSWRWKCHFSASTSHSSNKMRSHELYTVPNTWFMAQTLQRIYPQSIGKLTSETLSALNSNPPEFLNTQFFLHTESYLGQFWLLASSFQH